MITMSGSCGPLLLSCLAAAGLTLLPPLAPPPPPFASLPALTGPVTDLCLGDRAGSVLACDAYLRGVYEGLIAGQVSTPIETTSFCPPVQGLRPDDIRGIFLAFVGEDAGRRSEEAGWSLLSALEEDFPCSRAGEQQPPGDDGFDDEVVDAGGGYLAGAPLTALPSRSR